ncbi:hypothetical protein EVAR_94655_1 [Eumeta japonica]|uniref:Secreted protein n=1 Tax=Eumeta variegata TaxID=151549 RepID=A0A4C1UTQ7_EUMVA|nr:hypothetical protein EVAR_94655_1 [Eumeta japonica]
MPAAVLFSILTSAPLSLSISFTSVSDCSPAFFSFAPSSVPNFVSGLVLDSALYSAVNRTRGFWFWRCRDETVSGTSFIYRLQFKMRQSGFFLRSPDGDCRHAPSRFFAFAERPTGIARLLETDQFKIIQITSNKQKCLQIKTNRFGNLGNANARP